MRPTPIAWLIASRYTLPLWLGAALYFFLSHGGDWNKFNNDQQIAITIIGGVFAGLWLHSFPTVFFYEREQAAYKRSALSPEERWQRATVRQTVFLVLVAAALLYFGVQWWKSTPEPQPASYKAAAGVGGASILATTAYLKVKAWRSPSEPEQPAIVAWCLPIPKQSPSREQIALPDYCKRVLTAGAVRSPAPTADHKPEVNT